MKLTTDDAGRATVIVAVGGIERGRFRFNAVDGTPLAPLTTVEVEESRVRATALSLGLLVHAGEVYECRSASDPSV